MRLPNIKILLRWSSRTQIYGFVENHTFLEQFVRMGVPAQFVSRGVPAQFSNLGVPAQFSNLGVPAHFWSISLVHVLLYNFWIIWLRWITICMVTIRYKLMGGSHPASNESRRSL